ncbi:WW domain protein [Gracilaria domingensis]|nr:WW domain protein [Gracilaria domingensis]
MSAAPLEPTSKKPADDLVSQPESQHGKHIFNAVLKRPNEELQPFLRQALTELSGWGKATAASFLPEPMPLLEQSVDLQSSLQHHLIEQNPVSITPLFLRVFDMHANKQADNHFVKAKSVTSCALATGINPSLPYKVELGLEEAPPKQKAQPFVSTAPQRRARQGPSINDTFTLGRTTLGPNLDRNADQPVVHRNSLHLLTRRRRSSVATRKMSRMKISNEDPLDVEENDLEEGQLERPEGLTDKQWAAQMKNLLKKKDLGKVRRQINELKRRQEHREQEKHRPIEESNEEYLQNVVHANDTYYERSKRRQEREEKKREQANEALRKKKDVQRTRLENKKKRIEKRLKRTRKKGPNDASEDEVEEHLEADSEQEDNQYDEATLVHEETDQQTDSQGSKRQRLEAHDSASHTNLDRRYQSQHNQNRSEAHTGRHEYGYPSYNEVGGQRHPDHPMYPPPEGYQNASYSSHRPNDRQMFDNRASYDRPPYPPGPSQDRYGPRPPYYDPRPPQDFPRHYPGREASFHRNPEYPPNVSPERQHENGGGMHGRLPSAYPMNNPYPPNDVPFRPPMPPQRSYNGRPPQYDSGAPYYHQDEPPRYHPQGNYEPGPYQGRPPQDRRRPSENPNSPPTRYSRPAPFRPESEYYQGESSYRR